ncbi:hypothetical protein ACFFJY_10690 [Fictibacillus aquaticus]|uniref:Lipoprotein n=1 Tax=Fictibacillus aquaticus TaxID=2021314 RepID=A0A235FBW6_9BACL|nr:hypothetical protein [Fictibacillus aquaticus]OYD58722.1 hypothetical protein CGZ90_02135 [Fictibacillus aquaticus]
MKKVFGYTAAALLAFAVGCSDEKAEPKKEEKKTEVKQEKKDPNAEKIAILNFETDLVKQLRAYHAPFNAYAASLGADPKPAQADLDKMKADAKAAGEKAIAEIPSIAIPTEFSADLQAAYKAGFEDLKKSYEARVAGLDDAKKTEEADALFTSFEEKVNAEHEKLQLLPASFAAELQ